MMKKIFLFFKKVYRHETGILNFSMVIIFAFSFFFSLVVIFSDQFVPIHPTIKILIIFNMIINTILLFAFILVIEKDLKENKIYTYDEIKNNIRCINFLSFENANSLLLECIENEDFHTAVLLRDHINYKIKC